MSKDRSGDSILRYPDVRARTSLSRSTIERRVQAGTFPAPIKLSPGLLGWYESDINEWIADPMGWSAAA